ncbi:hypothetical protein [Paenibacillus sp. 2KB_22]|uniref:hypothetical protein n=1 Tax=Paenibacillus sp. 2KB_22 TaxID=3232978 RepID=UPI003F9695D3
MSSRTFFFRSEYSVKDMYERIYAPDFISVFKEYANSLDEDDTENVEANKSNCYTGLSQAYQLDIDRLHTVIRPVFDEYGRKGDRMNIKLYRSKAAPLTVTDEIRSRINSLINRNITEIDSFNPNLKYDLFIEEVAYREAYLDFKFRIEDSIIVHEPVPIREINAEYVEARYYFGSGIIALFNPNGTARQSKDLVKVIYLLFIPYDPKIEEVLLDEAQLIMIQLRLKGLVSSPRYRSDDDLRFIIHGLNEINYENPLVKSIQSNDSLTISELNTTCVVEGHRVNLKISEDGKLIIDTFVLPDVLDRIILDIEWVVLSEKYYKDMSTQIEALYKKISPAALPSHRTKRVAAIKDDLSRVVNEYRGKPMDHREIKLVSTVIFNIGCLLNDEKKTLPDEYLQTSSSNYSDLCAYYTNYFTVIKRMNRSKGETIARKTVQILQYLAAQSTGDAVDLIGQYEHLQKDE